jgi:hypothetical protein
LPPAKRGREGKIEGRKQFDPKRIETDLGQVGGDDGIIYLGKIGFEP